MQISKAIMAYVRKKKNRKGSGDKLSWQQVVLIALVLLLALLLIFSRGQRAARRVGPAVTPNEPGRTELAENPAQMRYAMATTSKEALLGRIDPPRDADFVPVDERYASRTGMYMRREAYEAFLEMHQAALADGHRLVILSATRPFDHQKRIWENKWTGQQVLHGGIVATDIADPVERAREILRFSAMPGTSRHHWGTDIDLNSLQNDYFRHGEGREIYRWLHDNAPSFGFCQPYTAHGERRRGGYEEEKWHWSYHPLASGFLADYRELVSYGDIQGFHGAEVARQLNVIEDYVLDINRECL